MGKKESKSLKMGEFGWSAKIIDEVTAPIIKVKALPQIDSELEEEAADGELGGSLTVAGNNEIQQEVKKENEFGCATLGCKRKRKGVELDCRHNMCFQCCEKQINETFCPGHIQAKLKHEGVYSILSFNFFTYHNHTPFP